ncbi:MAG TPA: site-2 protease family protein [Clostridia bacterium]
MLNQSLEQYILIIPVLLISLTIHELAHGYTAYRLGDMTAKEQGRLTLNPLKHLDPIGTIMLVVARIGWAKPVPVNPYFFRDRKRGMMLVSIAGPLSNLILAFMGIFLYQISFVTMYENIVRGSSIVTYWLLFLSMFFSINLNLAIFNLLPVPPLDGSKILSGILPADKYFRFMQYERIIGMIFLVAVIVFPGIISTVIGFFTKPIADSMLWVTDKIIGLFV